MADPMAPEQLAEAGQLIERAHKEIADLCKLGPSRWRMSIPAQPDRDSDLILSAALKAGEEALAEAERLRAERARAVAALGDIGRTAEAATGDLEDGINAELLAAHTTNEQIGAELAKVRAEVEQWRAIFGESALRDGLARLARVEAELAEAREQVKRTETAVHAYFADADERGVHLDGMTVDELCDAVMAAIRKDPA